MFNHDPYWGPRWEDNTLKIGDWALGTKGGLDKMKYSHEGTLRRMDERGIDRLVISQPAHMFMYWAGEFGTKFARIVNDELSKACAEEDRLDFWALVPMADPVAAPGELDRAVDELGAVGMMIGGADFAGGEVHDPVYEPLWDKVTELDVPVFVHGYNHSVAGAKDAHDASTIVGMPFYESVCVWHLICGGVLDRHPDLRIYVTHAGGFVPYHLGRLIHTNRTMAPDSVNQRSVEEYLGNFYFDPDVHEPIMRRALIDLIGVDHFVYGDNFGGADNFDGDLTDGIGLTDAQREAIKGENALDLVPRLAARL
jgi:aminocarboxymuconate-semialdehyde decarboxylase